MLLTATLLLPLFWIGLRLAGLSRFQEGLERSCKLVETSRSGGDLSIIATLVNIAGNHVPCPSTCLTRSLLLNWLLHRRGVRSELRIGVRMMEGTLDAHAWVEYEGKPINETLEVCERFALFDGALSPRSFKSRRSAAP